MLLAGNTCDIRHLTYLAGRSGDGPQALASLRNLTLGLLRLKNVNAIKETIEWVCRDQVRALQFMAT